MMLMLYKELFHSYYNRLLQFSLSITHSKQFAEEVVSDVFLKIWLKRKSLVKIQNKHLYLYIWAQKNHSINKLAKERRGEVFSFDECQVEIQSVFF
jgi:RNA polymerase sigma-70 factor (ECF subfamily)